MVSQALAGRRREHRFPTPSAVALNALGGQFFFQMVQGQDQARLGVLMTLGYALAAVVVLLADSRRLLPKPGTA